MSENQDDNILVPPSSDNDGNDDMYAQNRALYAQQQFTQMQPSAASTAPSSRDHSAPPPNKRLMLQEDYDSSRPSTPPNGNTADSSLANSSAGSPAPELSMREKVMQMQAPAQAAPPIPTKSSSINAAPQGPPADYTAYQQPRMAFPQPGAPAGVAYTQPGQQPPSRQYTTYNTMPNGNAPANGQPPYYPQTNASPGTQYSQLPPPNQPPLAANGQQRIIIRLEEFRTSASLFPAVSNQDIVSIYAATLSNTQLTRQRLAQRQEEITSSPEGRLTGQLVVNRLRALYPCMSAQEIPQIYAQCQGQLEVTAQRLREVERQKQMNLPPPPPGLMPRNNADLLVRFIMCWQHVPLDQISRAITETDGTWQSAMRWLWDGRAIITTPPQQGFGPPYNMFPLAQLQHWCHNFVGNINQGYGANRGQAPGYGSFSLNNRGAGNKGTTRIMSALQKSKQADLPILKQKKKRKNLSDSDSDHDYDSDGSDVRIDTADDARKEAHALQFFNSCKVEDLPGLTACTPEQAQMVVDMRPFATVGEVRTKLRKKKGVSANLFDSYVEIMDSYQEIDNVFLHCAKEGEELSAILKIWAGNKPPANGTPDGVNAGNTLTAASESMLNASEQQYANPEIKKAFEGYLRKQPNLGEGMQLKDYQLLGVNWLNLLYRRRTSCILADEMGLGKTAQVIAFFAHLKQTGSPGPHLVIVPSSTLDNWLREFERFAPTLAVYSYYGTQGERYDIRQEIKGEPNLDVVVTTYQMATGSTDDRKFLRKMEFQACVFDEGHQLKNSESKKHKDLMDIKVQWRLLLTGTPLQNNLQELVSLLSFILPKVFGAVADNLRAIFKVPADAQANLLTRQRIESAKKVMTPFVLRRKKAQVLQDLPKKIEIVEYCEMSNAQRIFYREAMIKSKKVLMEGENVDDDTAILDDIDEDGNSKAKKKGKKAAAKPKAKSAENSSNVLMTLRKAANHPMLFRRIYDDETIRTMSKDCLNEPEFADRNVDYIYEDMSIMTDFELNRFVQPYAGLRKYSLSNEEWMQAGKIDFLKENLPKMKANGDRILIFSQFVSILEILQMCLDTMGFRYITLTGSTNVGERQGLVDQFTNDPDITCFLLSTRAGGLGLNLMAANVVILHDQDFNPHSDKQAQDRAYRLGQTRDVTIYKLISKGTIEEDILKLADTKLALDQRVSAGGVEEGNEEQVEKKVKNGLLSSLRRKFEQGDEGAAALVKEEAIQRPGQY